ncbi:GNAT family N-acetyltransferase [Photobacterium leiognathi]|uniref:GNAT family N-acetyltransferase n=1 Tax=Photobacterium leiognathi TaxID=553611 RepID=UPI002732D46E|nr:N-acetyltransferase [Photobacterium leiognathi]
MTYHIRKAEKADVTTAYLLERELFGEHSYPDFFFRQAYDCWSDGFLVAVTQSQEVVGYVLASPSFIAANEHVREAWILGVAVDAKMQGQGVGKALLKEALAQLANYNCIWLTVHPDNKALKLYESLGFVVVEQEDNYFGCGSPRLKMRLSR